jgi:uncharacterized UPF0160 family protein
MLAVTHSGIFHADEVFAVASLIKWNKEVTGVCCLDINDSSNTSAMEVGKTAWIIRTRSSAMIAKTQNSETIYVIDNGEVYDSKSLNFDHHQDRAMQASNMLVFKHILEQGLIDKGIYEKLLPFMEGISDFDTNKDNTNLAWSQYNAEHKFRNMSNVISGYNRDPRDEEQQNKQFEKAVEFAITVLDNEEYSAIQRISAEAIYDSREILGNNVAVFDEFCPIWKTKEEHKYAILPNPQGWSLNSANSNEFPLPTIEHKDLIFAHKGLFIAVFSTKEAALEIALTL